MQMDGPIELRTAERGTRGRNRAAYVAEALVEYFISLLVAGAFLAMILKQTGVPDSVTGVTTALSSLAFMGQLVSALFIRTRKTPRRFILWGHLINQLMFVLLYAIPFIHIPQIIKIALFVCMYLGGHLIANMVAPFKLSWLMSYVDDRKRGAFTAKKEIISLVGGMAFSFLMGSLIDYYEGIGQTETGCILCGITILVLSIAHFAALAAVKDGDEPEETGAAERMSVKKALGLTLGNPCLRKVIFLGILWHMGTGISVSFYGTYQINELGFSMGYAALLTAGYSVMRVGFSQFFGRFADRHSWAKMLSLCFMIGCIAYCFNIFTVPANGKVFYALYYMIYGVYMAGANSGIMNITFDYVKPEHRAYALGVKSAVGGLFGFLAALVGGRIVAAVQASGNLLLGNTVYAQQILSLLAFGLFAAAVVYINRVIVKLPQVGKQT